MRTDINAKSHAKLSASGAHRWMVCPGSIRMEREYPDSSSEFAREGTAAHELADWCLREDNTADFYLGREITVEEDTFIVDNEMADNVEQYVDYVRSLGGHVYPEQRVDFSQWVEDGFGTADAIIIKGGVLVIVDLKYGKGVRVEATNNPQLQLYALGALTTYDYLNDIHTVRMAIVQPRLEHISEWEIDIEDLFNFGSEAHEKAVLALQANAPCVPDDKACRFCKAKAGCRALAQKHLETIKGDFEDLSVAIETPVPTGKTIAKLSNDDLAGLLAQVDDIKSWLAAIETRCQSELEAGEAIPGYKLVAGRSLRAWDNEEATLQALRKMRVKVADIMTAPKLKSVAQLEKTLGKKHRIFTEHVIKPDGKPTIAPVSDKRPAINLNPIDGFTAITTNAL